MECTLNQLTKLSGVSARTLRYYDQIGLIKPLRVETNGYRIYGEKEIDLLQEVLLYKKLNFSLKEIASLVSSNVSERQKSFQNHLETLNATCHETELLISNVKQSLHAMSSGESIENKDKFIGLSHLKNISNESERVSKLYEMIDENSRLSKSRAARIEFITNTTIIDRYLNPGSNILDIGAGTGEYSLHYARKGFAVTGIDLSESNLAQFKSKLPHDSSIELIQANATALPLESEMYDVVLVFGPLYHLSSEHDRSMCILEAMRVCKKGGVLLFTFINHDMIPFTETFCYNTSHFLDVSYDALTHRVENFPFVFFTVEEAKAMIIKGGLEILSVVASEGLSELMAQKVNCMSDAVYERYLDYHLHVCEKPEMLGTSNHLIIAARNPQ